MLSCQRPKVDVLRGRSASNSLGRGQRGEHCGWYWACRVYLRVVLRWRPRRVHAAQQETDEACESPLREARNENAAIGLRFICDGGGGSTEGSKRLRGGERAGLSDSEPR
jgi:hypothetical protein